MKLRIDAKRLAFKVGSGVVGWLGEGRGWGGGGLAQVKILWGCTPTKNQDQSGAVPLCDAEPKQAYKLPTDSVLSMSLSVCVVVLVVVGGNNLGRIWETLFRIG